MSWFQPGFIFAVDRKAHGQDTSYSIPTHIIARARGNEFSSGIPSGHKNVAEGAVHCCLLRGKGWLAGYGVWFLCESFIFLYPLSLLLLLLLFSFLSHCCTQ